jgi:hypothetical protein
VAVVSWLVDKVVLGRHVRYGTQTQERAADKCDVQDDLNVLNFLVLVSFLVEMHCRQLAEIVLTHHTEDVLAAVALALLHCLVVHLEDVLCNVVNFVDD